MKRLFLLGRTRRSVASLETELTEFERRLQLPDGGIESGDLVFWITTFDTNQRSKRTNYPVEFGMKYKSVIESGLLSEYVVGEIGRTFLSASETGYVDNYKGESYMYGTTDDKLTASTTPDDEDEEIDGDDYASLWADDDPYAERLFWTCSALQGFGNEPTEEALSFGRKLLIVFGRDPKYPFLESRTGLQLRQKLGGRARVILSAQGENATAIAFDYEATCQEFFEQNKRLLPPRLVEDFLVIDVGMNYFVGDQPISLFGEWANQHPAGHNSSSQTGIGHGTRSSIPVEVNRRKHYFRPKRLANS